MASDRRRLAAWRLQLSVSRKKLGSTNRKKAVARLNARHGRIAEMRRDFLHQATTRLVADHALIVIEDLAVKNMNASAAGTVEAPGRDVRAKAGLNRTILRNGWSMARSMLEYKSAWLGVMLVAVPPAYMSQECSAWGHMVDPATCFITWVSPLTRAIRSEISCRALAA